MMVRVDGVFKQWIFGVPILLIVVIVRGAQGQNACSRTSYVSRSRSVSQRYTTSCGAWGGSRCTRYRYYTGYYQASVTTYDICCAGWSKDSYGRCLIAHCSNPCQHGSCSSPNVCTCNSGYKGPTCNQAHCSNPCQHGSCSSPNVCTCNSGYKGLTCNQAHCSNPCQHGSCSSPNVCTCNNGYKGPTCNQAICDPPCQYGTCSSPDVCTCYSGYDGQICSQAVCDLSCQNGGVCTSPNNCSCLYGYTGETCNQGVWCTELIDEPMAKMTSMIAAGRPLSGACLQNHVIYTFLSRNLVACAFTCKRNSRCKSFNYFTNEGRCELNSVGSEGSSKGDWVENMDCVYYQS